MTNTAEVLKSLAKKYLNEEGQTDIEIDLSDGDERSAKEYLLGAIDRLWQNGEIDAIEAKGVYDQLGFKPEDAARIRQRSGKWL